MFRTVEKAGLFDIFKPIFRPPAWKMSKDAISASIVNNIKILALSSKFEYEGDFEHIVYATCNPPFAPLELSEKTEIVYHACEWDKNYLDKEKTQSLIEFFKANYDKINFCFMLWAICKFNIWISGFFINNNKI